MLRNYPYYEFSQRRIVHIFYGEVSSYNRTNLNATCQGNLMLKPPSNAIKIIEDMCSNPYNNYGDKKIMKRSVNQLETKVATFGLGQQIQALSQQIQKLIKIQSQVPNSTPLYHTCERYGCVHGLGEFTMGDEFAQTMDEINFVGGIDNGYER